MVCIAPCLVLSLEPVARTLLDDVLRLQVSHFELGKVGVSSVNLIGWLMYKTSSLYKYTLLIGWLMYKRSSLYMYAEIYVGVQKTVMSLTWYVLSLTFAVSSSARKNVYPQRSFGQPRRVAHGFRDVSDDDAYPMAKPMAKPMDGAHLSQGRAVRVSSMGREL